MSGKLKEVRERIKTVINTQQITKAMKMVSAAKLRRAQQAIQEMRPYANKLNQMLRNILSNLDGDVQTSFGVERPVEKVCIVVITSNRGLAGAFNTNICKQAFTLIQEKYTAPLQNGQLTIYFIGKKGYDYFKSRVTNATFNRDYINLFDDLSFDSVARLSQKLMDDFEHHVYDVIEVSYAQFKNAATQISTIEQFLPVAKLEAENEGDKTLKADYIFEPGKEGLLEFLVPSILQTQFHKFLLDNHASEHGARMTAMDKATENANELLRDLKISYNKVRQEAITKEILEIVGGAAALEAG